MMGWRNRLLGWAGHHCEPSDEESARLRCALGEAEQLLIAQADRLRDARSRVAELERREYPFRTAAVVMENADLHQENAVLRTRLALGDKSELLRERETSRELEARNAALEAQVEALRR